MNQATNQTTNQAAVKEPVIRTEFPGGRLGVAQWVAPGHLRVTIYREWDHARINTQATWFYFRLENVKAVPLTVELIGLCDIYGTRPGPSITPRSKAVISYDNVTWQHLLDAEWNPGSGISLILKFTPREDTVWIAHLEPYVQEHLDRLVADHEGNPYLVRETAGLSFEGREIPLWTVTDPAVPESEKKVVWLMARQHAWETYTSYCLDGLTRYLLADTPEAAELRKRLIVKLLPWMDPDGVERGGTRFNRLGYDINRHWDLDLNDAKACAAMPEIAAGKRAIKSWLDAGHRIDLLLALHDTVGDLLIVPRDLADDPRIQSLFEKMKAIGLSASAISRSGPITTVSVSLYNEYGIPGAILELGTTDLPYYGRQVTAADWAGFGARLAAVLGEYDR